MSTYSLKHKLPKLFVILSLALIITLPPFFAHPATAQTQTTQYYDRSFAWDYDGRHWTWNLSIPQALYEAYKSVPDPTRTRDGPSGYSMMVTTQDPFLVALVQKINQTATQEGFSSLDEVNFVLAFVQSIPYKSDLNTTGWEEYPRFPIETLVDQAGDCDCKAILFGTLVVMLGYGAVFINPPDHLAIGVLGNNLHGTYWEYPKGSNQTYYYSETTGEGFTVGQLPDEFKDQTAYVYPIDPSQQYVANVNVVVPQPTDYPYIQQGSAPQPTPTGSPGISDPNIQQVRPMSINLITDDPALFVVIIFAIVASIGLTVWSIRRPKQHPSQVTPMQPTSPAPEPQVTAPENKYCIFCGSSNKGYAAYCESCGKQIG